jgi:hypothetical protein
MLLDPPVHIAAHAREAVMEAFNLIPRDEAVLVRVEPSEHPADVLKHFVAGNRAIGHHHVHPLADLRDTRDRPERRYGRRSLGNAWRRRDLGCGWSNRYAKHGKGDGNGKPVHETPPPHRLSRR